MSIKNNFEESNLKFEIIGLDHVETVYNCLGIPTKQFYYKLKCIACGEEKVIRQQSIKSASCISPTCRKPKEVFGKSQTRLHRIWSGIKGRCYCQTSTAYKKYGAKGITMHEEWKEDFKAFYNWAMQNGYDDSLSIDRLKSSGNYVPENCRWATNKQQHENRENTIYVTVNDTTMTLLDWSNRLNVSYKTLFSYYTNKMKKTIEEYIEYLLKKELNDV